MNRKCAEKCICEWLKSSLKTITWFYAGVFGRRQKHFISTRTKKLSANIVSANPKQLKLSTEWILDSGNQSHLNDTFFEIAHGSIFALSLLDTFFCKRKIFAKNFKHQFSENVTWVKKNPKMKWIKKE